MGYQIAIDGPAGAGKSTVAKLLAGKLGYTYMDTGAMYRAIGLHFLDAPAWPETPEEILELCGTADVGIRYIDGVQKVYLNGEDISAKIRQEEVGNAASKASTYPEVRERLVDLQRQISSEMDVVMDGRDIGTVVLPDADLKIFLTADIDVRARRRFDELIGKGLNVEFENVKADVIARDKQDMTRKASPLKQAEDAVFLDSSDMNAEEVADRILMIKEEKDAGNNS